MKSTEIKPTLLHLAHSEEEIPWITSLVGLGNSVGRFEHRFFYLTGNTSSVCRNYSQLSKLILQEAGKFPSLSILLVSHGHLPSIISLLIHIRHKIPFIVVHHHQPFYFHFFDRRLRSRIHEFLYKRYVLAARSNQALSPEVVSKLSLNKVSEEHFIEIGHGIDRSYFTSESKRETATAKFKRSGLTRLLMVGRLSSEKGYCYALEIMKYLNSTSADFQLTIVGVGPLEQELRELVVSYKLEKSVIFLGFQNDMHEIYSQYGILLHTSRTESYCQVLVEALASGLRIVSTNVGVLPNLQKSFSDRILVLTGEDFIQDAKKIQGFCHSFDNFHKENIPKSLLRSLRFEHEIDSCQLRSIQFLEEQMM
jgi:glycosyltransferase involved in cell wall biosynthesis